MSISNMTICLPGRNRAENTVTSYDSDYDGKFNSDEDTTLKSSNIEGLVLTQNAMNII